MTTLQEEEVDPLDAYVDDVLGDAPVIEQETEAVPEDATSEVEEAEQEPEVEPEEEFFEIKHNGKPVKLKLEEVQEYAQKGFDYTTKTQELAEQRRQIEQYAQHVQAQAQAQQQFQKETVQIAAMDAQLSRYKEVDWAQWTDSDPVEATKGWQRYQILQQQRHEMANDVGQRQAKMQAEMQQRAQAMLADADRQLSNELGKAWNAETKKALVETGTSYGLTAEELQSVTDPRLIKILYDAHKYRAMQARKPAIDKRVAEAPKLAKPGGKPAVSAAETQKQQLRKMLKSGTSTRSREKAAFALLDDFVK